jgi:hypothetical protein
MELLLTAVYAGKPCATVREGGQLMQPGTRTENRGGRTCHAAASRCDVMQGDASGDATEVPKWGGRPVPGLLIHGHGTLHGAAGPAHVFLAI